MAKHEPWELAQMQALPLKSKIAMTKQRVRAWIDHWDGNVYVSFSGGKDSTVLLDIVRQVDESIPAVFVDTGLEYPEIREFVKTFENVVWLKPKMNFREVIEKYGYPLISKEVSLKIARCKKKKDSAYLKFFSPECKSIFNVSKYAFALNSPFKISNMCCDVMKKQPVHDYGKVTGRKAITGQMADESDLRRRNWMKYGCNMFEAKYPISNPMSFWTEQDVLQYIKEFKLPICSVYGDIVTDSKNGADGQMALADFIEGVPQPKLKTTGCYRTGCMFCGYGCHLEKGEGRFERMKKTHPKTYDWIMKPWSDGGLDYKNVIDWLNENGNLNIKY